LESDSVSSKALIMQWIPFTAIILPRNPKFGTESFS
jgi:hypothetical protein